MSKILRFLGPARRDASFEWSLNILLTKFEITRRRRNEEEEQYEQEEEDKEEVVEEEEEGVGEE